jgi:hypothetical protein
VEGLSFAWFHNMGVIAEPVKQLRPVGLRVDWLQFIPLDEDVVFVAVDNWSGDV